jgi:hypothetical protein
MKLSRRHLIGIMVFVFVFVLGLCGNAYAITNGQPDGDEHPYVGLLVFDVEVEPGVYVPAWRCSGSLISPTVVLCAGHCTYGAARARVWFDEVVEGNPEYPFGGVTSYEGTPHTHPDFWYGAPQLPEWLTHDVGVVVLDEPVPLDVLDEYGELPTEDLVDTLPMMADVDQVGYGVQWQERPVGPEGPYYAWTGPKIRMFAPAKLIASEDVVADEFIRLTANPAQEKGGTAFGDSGGPNLLGGTNIILGVTSWGTNVNCAGVSYASRVDTADVLEWIYGEFGHLLG